MKLKLLLTFCLVMLLTVTAAIASISSNMKLIGAKFKTITLTMNDQSQAPKNIVLADEIISAFKAVRVINPGVGNFSEFQALIDQEIVLFGELKKHLASGDKAQLLATIEQINLVKKEAHSKFN